MVIGPNGARRESNPSWAVTPVLHATVPGSHGYLAKEFVAGFVIYLHDNHFVIGILI